MRDREQERLEHELSTMRASPSRGRHSPVPLLTAGEREIIGLALLKRSHFTERQRKILHDLTHRKILGYVWGNHYLTEHGRKVYAATERQLPLFGKSPMRKVYSLQPRGNLPPLTFYTKRGLDTWLKRNPKARNACEIIERPPTRFEERVIAEGRADDGWLWSQSSPKQKSAGLLKRFARGFVRVVRDRKAP